MYYQCYLKASKYLIIVIKLRLCILMISSIFQDICLIDHVEFVGQMMYNKAPFFHLIIWSVFTIPLKVSSEINQHKITFIAWGCSWKSWKIWSVRCNLKNISNWFMYYINSGTLKISTLSYWKSHFNMTGCCQNRDLNSSIPMTYIPLFA